MARASIHDLDTIITRLDKMGRLLRVHSTVDPVHDLAAIAAAYEGGPRAVLFESVANSEYPVFTGLYWSRELLAALTGKDEAELPSYVGERIARWQKRPRPPVVRDNGPVIANRQKRVNLGKLPIPTHALEDGGPYLDAGVVIARDPESGVRNASIQRFMVADRNTLVINIDAGRHLETYLQRAATRGETLPLSINIGVGPGLHFAAATPAEAAPIDSDELGIASEFHGAPLELVAGTGTHSRVEMVAHAMFALECEIIPGELADEGPFAEVTGYYATREPRPVVHVKAVYHRDNQIGRASCRERV